MKILDYLKENILISDGDMGTYYNEIVKEPLANCVLANIYAPEVIQKIHNEYIDAGAKLIRTNTFCANTKILNRDLDFVKDVIRAGCQIVKKCVADKNVFIAGSIGPIPDIPPRPNRPGCP